MVYHYRTRGVCSQEMRIELNDDHTIKGVAIIGGCNGNLQGISRLVEGMKAEDAIERMRGIRCGFKDTSCPDQLAIALTEALAQMQWLQFFLHSAFSKAKNESMIAKLLACRLDKPPNLMYNQPDILSKQING